MTVFAFIILDVFGHIRNINERVESNLQESRKENKEVTLCTKAAAFQISVLQQRERGYVEV